MHSNMTRKEAMEIVIRGAQKYLTYLHKKLETEPEGIEVHLTSFIKQLSVAIRTVQKGTKDEF